MPTAKKKPTLASLPELKKALIKHTDAFCKTLLNTEYRDMCRVMAKGLCVDKSPALKGDARTWAAAIVGAVGYVNALHDTGSSPHHTKAQLAKKMDIPLAVFNKHAKTLIDGFDLIPFDPDFTLPSMIPMNPLIAMACSPTLLGSDCCQEGSCCEGGSCSMEDCDKEDCCQLQMVPKKKVAKKRK